MASHPVDFVAVGHITIDRTPAGATLGGSVTYAALTAARLDRSVGIVTACDDAVDLSPLDGITVKRKRTSTTTTFANYYQGGARTQRLDAVAQPLELNNIPRTWCKPDQLMLAPVANEIPIDLASAFEARTTLAAIQGWLRQPLPDGTIAAKALSSLRLPGIDIVIASDEDLAGLEDAEHQLDHLAELVIITRAERGAMIVQRAGLSRQRFVIPAYPARVVDPTGAGDVFAAAFLIRLAETGDPAHAGHFASAAASLAIEASGIDGIPDRSAIEQRLRHRSTLS